jgi:hypothetical protein
VEAGMTGDAPAPAPAADAEFIDEDAPIGDILAADEE